MPKPRKDRSRQPEKAEPEDYRLNKFLAHAGVASRRKSDELIRQGLVSVNGEVVREVGVRVTREDRVEYMGRRVFPDKKVYILLNKPRDVISTTDDDRGRRTVLDLVDRAVDQRVYPVGRLDRNTTGLILLTNDGDLAQRLAHPSGEVKKLYKVTLDRPLTKADFERITEGVQLEEGIAKVDDLAYADDNRKVVGVEVHIGWNRIIRRIFESLGYEIDKLDRVMYAGLTKKNLPRGKWRNLSDKEVIRLKHFSGSRKGSG